MKQTPGRTLFSYRGEAAAVALLILAVWGVFGQTLSFDFVNYDDPAYVTSNVLLMQGPLDLFTVADAFLEVGRGGNWHPLTWVSLMLDYQLFHLDPWGYHLTNVLLHSANVVLLFVLLRWLTGCLLPSALVAGFFAVHPTHVESVAWVTERKDVLSTLFWLLTTLAYIAYVRRPSWRRYLLVLTAFSLGLLAKPMLVTLPATLLLLDYWPLGRFSFSPASRWTWDPSATTWQLIREKLPLVLLSVGAAAMTIWAQKKDNSLRTFEQLPLVERLGNALLGVTTYLRQLFWPSGLAPFYPLSPWRLTDLVLPAALVLSVTMLALLGARRQPALLVGWLWFLGTLVPVIGLVQVGWQAHADRYTYIPYIGLLIAVIWLGFGWMHSPGGRAALGGVLLTALLAAGVAAWRQTGIWRNSVALWEHTLAVTRNNYVAHLDLAVAYREAGRIADAGFQVERAAAVCPDDTTAYVRVARLWSSYGEPERARHWLEEGIRKHPERAAYYFVLGQVLHRLQRPDEAEAWQRRGELLGRATNSE
jgi:tetratricopeptide (TPR) repeat protein